VPPLQFRLLVLTPDPLAPFSEPPVKLSTGVVSGTLTVVVPLLTVNVLGFQDELNVFVPPLNDNDPVPLSEPVMVLVPLPNINPAPLATAMVPPMLPPLKPRVVALMLMVPVLVIGLVMVCAVVVFLFSVPALVNIPAVPEIGEGQIPDSATVPPA